MRTLPPVLAALLAHWRRHPVGLATLLAGLALATALWSGVQALNAEARSSYARAAAVIQGDGLAAIVATDGGRFALADYITLRREGWAVSPVLEGTLRAGGTTLRVVGVEPLTLPAGSGPLAPGAAGIALADFLRPPHRGLAAPETLAALAAAGDAGVDLPPLVATAALPPETIVTDIARAEALLGTEGRLSRLLLPPGEAGRDLPASLAERLRIVAPETATDLERLTESFHLNLAAFGLLSFTVGLLIVYGSVGLAFEQRRPTLRTLRALGTSARTLTLALFLETVAIALVAGLAGMGLGYIVAAALLPDVAASLRGLYGARLPGTLALDRAWWAAGLAMALAGGLAAAASSLWRARRLPVLAPARPEAWLGATRRALRVQGLAGAGLLMLAGAALAWGGGLAAGFLAMAGLLLGAALLLPLLLSAGLAAGAARARHPVAQWLWADGRQELGGLSLALMALLVALAVAIGVGTMVGSFRTTFLAYLDQRLAPEIYVSAPDAETAGAVEAWLAARPEVAATLPTVRAESRVGDWPAEVIGIRDHATYRADWPVLAALPDAWDRVAAGGGVMVSEQLARRAGLAPGDALVIPSPVGPWTTIVAGIHPDYGNPLGQIVAAIPEVTARWSDARRTQLGARADPEAVPAILDALRGRFGLGANEAVDQATVKAVSTRVFERTFAVTVALNALTLLVAGVALLTALLALSGQRLARAAPLWALGLRRRRIAGLELLRAVALAAATAVLALPLGLAVAWVLTAVVNPRAFGWRIPLALFPADWVVLLAMALATALIAALLPAARLARARPIDLLRSFSNDR